MMKYIHTYWWRCVLAHHYISCDVDNDDEQRMRLWRLVQELTIMQLIEKRRRQLLIHYRYIMLGFKLIGNECTISIDSSSVCKMMHIIGVENMLCTHDYIFNYHSKLITSVSPLWVSAPRNVNFMIFVRKLQIRKPSSSISSYFFPTIEAYIQIKHVAYVDSQRLFMKLFTICAFFRSRGM